MALNVTTTFNGSHAGEILLDLFNRNVMFDPRNAKQLVNVANKMSLTTLTSTGFITKPYNCDFVGGDITLSDKALNPEAFVIEREFCKSVLWGTWLSFTQRNNLTASEAEMIDVNNVEAFVQYVLEEAAKKGSSEIAQIIWRSTAGNATPGLAQISGLREQMLADATVIDVPAAAVITSANAVAAFQKVLELVPSEVLGDPEFQFYANQKTVSLYLMNVTSTSDGVRNATNQSVDVNFMGYRIVVDNGIPDNTIVATVASNFVVATNIDDSTNMFKVIDMSETTGDDKVRIRGQYRLDATYVFGNNIVLYTV